ncbi:MAG TPA: glycosyltransferase family 39 protein [Flavobacterium sp.]|jgi:hypothetical protein
MRIVEKIKTNWALSAILLAGAILRLYRLNYQSVWLDEIHTLNDANPAFSAGQVYDSILMADPHPPLYFYIIQILFKIFGYLPVVARAFSAIVGIYTIYALYKFGRELVNKNTGLLAAALLAVNGFHIYHSQDARPYSLLCLTTILSFLYLIRYIKLPTRKNALLYGLFSALMLYGHFFSLFALLGQMTVLAFFFIISKEARKPFLINSLLAGLLMAILFIPPSLKIFIVASKIKNFWIPAPTPDVYTLIFYEFFGNSEIILCLFGIIITLYFIRLAKEKPSKPDYDSVTGNKNVFSFILLAAWIITVIFIPLVRSYLSTPMIIGRYFINVLPAILIIIAVGLTQFRNQGIRLALLGILLLFSITDLIIVKKYYKTICKTQFREVTEFIVDNNRNNEPVVTNLPWYLPYFLNTGTHKYNIVDKKLDPYVYEMTKDSTLRKPFWYMSAHGTPYKVDESTQQYLDEHFVVENSIDMFDAWTKHYVLKTGQTTIVDISKYKPLKDSNGDPIEFWVDQFEVNQKAIKIQGWAYLRGCDSQTSKVQLVMVHKKRATKIEAQIFRRDDIKNDQFNVSNCGFSAELDLADLPTGEYRLGIYITNNVTKKEGLVLTNKIWRK